MTVAFAFTCTKCGDCCKHGGPALSIDEVFKYQDFFITGLRWGANALPRKFVTTFRGETVDVQKLRHHCESFTGPTFDDKGDTIHPHIYPLVTGYAIGRPCPALQSDGACELHDDKPTRCRSVPLDPALPESLQGIPLRDFEKQHNCMSKVEADAANVIYRDGRITDASYKDDYDRRLAVMQKDRETLAVLYYLLGDDDKPRALAPTLADFMTVVDSGGWAETSMVPLLFVLLKNKDITPAAAERYIHSQIRIIGSEIEAALQRRDSSERGRTALMRSYLAAYRTMLDDTGKLEYSGTTPRFAGAADQSQTTRREIILAKGVTLYWRKDETGKDEYGIDADEPGYRYLEQQAKDKGQTVEQFSLEVLTKSFEASGVELDPATMRSWFSP